VRFVLLSVVTLAIAALPSAAVLFFLAGPVENWPAAAGHPAVWVAVGLSASVFWSLETLAYLQLRASVDATDPNEIARDSKPEVIPVAAPPPEDRLPAAAPRQAQWPGLGPVGPVLMLGLMVVTWFLTAWLFGRFGGQNAGWLGWGMGGQLMPAAQGYYLFAALLAGLWSVLWLIAPFVVMLRRAIRGEPAPPDETPPGPTDGAASAEPLLQ
jgi:hypothetical protein